MGLFQVSVPAVAICSPLLERGLLVQVDRNVEREICNHRMLNHPNIVGFKEVGRQESGLACSAGGAQRLTSLWATCRCS